MDIEVERRKRARETEMLGRRGIDIALIFNACLSYASFL
jgi:hypothetical protein